MPFGSSKSAGPEDEYAVQQDASDGNAEESANTDGGAGDGNAQEMSAPAGNGQTEGEPYKRMSFRPAAEPLACERVSLPGRIPA